jgi:hypothetical protein
MRDVFQALSEPARTLRLVNSIERQIVDLKAYEQRSRARLALVTALVAALFDRRVDERGVVIFVAFLLVAAGLLPYLAVRSRRRALERRRDGVLNSGSKARATATSAPLSSDVESRTTPRTRAPTPVRPTSEPTGWLWRKVPADS